MNSSLRLDGGVQALAPPASGLLPAEGGVSVALWRGGRLPAVAATDPVVLETDHDQYDTGEGPCLDAATSGRQVRVLSLSTEHRWPAFGPRARSRGVEAILSLPLVTSDRPVGALTVYAGAPGALSEGSTRWAELFATQASILMAMAALTGSASASASTSGVIAEVTTAEEPARPIPVRAAQIPEGANARDCSAL